MLTSKQIESLKPKQSLYRVREKGDPDTKGFGCAIAPSGSRTFFLAFTSPEEFKNGKPARKQIALGKYPGVTLAEARQRAKAARKLLDRGVDPAFEQERVDVEKNKQKRVEEDRKRRDAAMGTVAQLFDYYIRDMEADGKRSANQVQGMYDLNIADVIGNKQTRNVTIDDCADIITTIADRGALIQANRVRSYLRAAFEFGLSAHMTPRWRKKVPDFGLQFNPAAQTKRAARERKGDRYLSRDEVREFWSRSSNELQPSTALALKMLLATGQRVEEVLGASWSEFDLEEKLWTIPGRRRKSRHKTVEDHLVPLTDFHIKILEEVRVFSTGGRYLFPKVERKGIKNDGKVIKHRSEPRSSGALSQALRRFCIPQDNRRRSLIDTKRKGFVPFQPRDLRRTWKTLSGSIGLSLEIRNRIQGHALQDVGSQHYDRWDYLDEKRASMLKWTNWLQNVVSGKKSRNVVRLRRGEQS